MTGLSPEFAILGKLDGIFLAGERPGHQTFINLADPDPELEERLRKRLTLVRQRPDFMEMSADQIAAVLMRPSPRS